MTDILEKSKLILANLVGFETRSAQSNLDFINYVKTYLAEHSVKSHISFDETKLRANIYAQIGPDAAGGVVLNGHTDIVPVSGQDWHSNPFELVEKDNRLYGRGAVDMKGFLACILAMVPEFLKLSLKQPIYISMCYDEEIGGFGAPVLVEHILANGHTPRVAIVGEPTGMNIVNGHKGGVEMRTTFKGFEAHASDPRKGVNSIQYAAKFINYLYELADNLKAKSTSNSIFEPPYTTFNVGTINGGAARNIIAGTTVVDWEFRPIENIDPMQILNEIKTHVEINLLPQMKLEHKSAEILFETQAVVPALSPQKSVTAVNLIRQITGKNHTEQVSFGTDAGHFCEADISTIVMGPGSIEQAHKPNEYIEISQMAKCLVFLDVLGRHMAD